MNEDDVLSLIRLNMLGDWIKLKINFNSKKMLDEISKFDLDWKQYNPRKPINRQGLSITSFDGKLTGVPDLDSIGEYNRQHGTFLDNYSCTVPTDVYYSSNEIQNVLSPFKDHLLRTHFIRLNTGGFFPDHRDCYPEFENDKREQIRLLFFVNKCDISSFKLIYDNKVVTNLQSGTAYYFNGNKIHCGFSTSENCVMIVANLKFDTKLYQIITNYMEIN